MLVAAGWPLSGVELGEAGVVDGWVGNVGVASEGTAVRGCGGSYKPPYLYCRQRF